MLESARVRGIDPDRVGLIDAVRWLGGFEATGCATAQAVRANDQAQGRTPQAIADEVRLMNFMAFSGVPFAAQDAAATANMNIRSGEFRNSCESRNLPPVVGLVWSEAG